MGVFRRSALRKHETTHLYDTLAQKLSRSCQRFRDLARVFASALRAFRTPAAFSAHDWRDLLDEFVRLKFRGEFFRNRSDQCNASLSCAREKNWAVEFWLKC